MTELFQKEETVARFIPHFRRRLGASRLSLLTELSNVKRQKTRTQSNNFTRRRDHGPPRKSNEAAYDDPGHSISNFFWYRYLDPDDHWWWDAGILIRKARTSSSHNPSMQQQY